MTMHRLSYVVFAGCVFAGSVAAGAQVLPPQTTPRMQADANVPPAVAQAVNAAFPKDLLYKILPEGEGAPVYPYQSCATMFRRGSDANPDLVAAAYSGAHTEIAMLSYSAGHASIVGAFTDRLSWFPGGSCEASIVNLADPAQPDSPLANAVQISFGGADWYFLWTGGKLLNVTAPYYEFGPNRPPYTDMAESEAVDLDHSGPMQIVGRNGDWDKFPQDDGIEGTGTWTLFRYNGSAYAPAEKLQYFSDYSGWERRWPDQQQINMRQWPAATYELTVVNGSRDGKHRVVGATITLNGRTILSPSDVNKSVETVSRTVILNKQNSIGVTLQGGKDARFYVLVKEPR